MFRLLSKFIARFMDPEMPTTGRALISLDPNEYDDPPRVEPRKCGGCFMFVPDLPDAHAVSGGNWGRCSVRKVSVTTNMQAVLRRGEATCYMEKP